MGDEVKKRDRFPYFAIGLFLVLAIIFSTFRGPIGFINKWFLLMTGEVNLRERGTSGDSDVEYVTVKGKKVVRKKKTTVKKKTIKQEGKPVLTNLPKTPPGEVLFVKSKPELNDTKIPLFPEIRKFDGTRWTREKTELRMATDGKKLYLFCRCYDRYPEDIITKHTENDGEQAWKDDGIEFFLMKDRYATSYCQYAASASGKGCIYYMEIRDANNKRNGTRVKNPPNFTLPYIDAKRYDDGFLIILEIALSNIGITELKPGDQFLMQLTRNYRGQGLANSINLQLFPTHIYGDNRFGGNNHDRRAFQPVFVVDTPGKASNRINVVKVPDVNLRKEFESLLNISPGDKIDAKKLKKMTSFKAIDKKLFDLRGVEYCEKLKDLDLSSNRIRGISTLNALYELEKLNLSSNKIREIGGLVELVKLKELDLSNNRIEDIRVLGFMPDLEKVKLDNNKIKDIAPLLKCKKLKKVELKDNSLSSKSEKSILPKLKQNGAEVIY